MSEALDWFSENIMPVVAIILISIAILLMAGLLIYLAVIGICSVVKSIKSARSKKK